MFVKDPIHTVISLMCLPLVAACFLSFPHTVRADDAASAPPAVGSADPATTAAEAAPRGEVLQEIVVTAQRREEALSKVPISVTALTQADMDQKGIKDFLDVARFTPGVSIDNSATKAITIRGISSSGGAGTTGIYIDDTPIQMRSVGFNPDDTLPKTFDLERVEILRGPQGTLFGAGAEGGAVRYILTQPKVTGTNTSLRSEISYTHYAGTPNYELGIGHGQPIIDGTLGVRASVWYRWDGGWIDRVDSTTRADTESNVNHAGTLLARLAGLWQPNEALSITPSILYQNSKKHDDSTYWPAYSNPSAGNFNTATPEPIPNDDEYYLPALKVQWDLGKSAMIANASYYHRKQITAYQGTVFDLSYYQVAGETFGVGCQATGDPSGCPWFPLIDGSGIHLPGAPGCLPDQLTCFTNYVTPNIMTNSQENYTAELRWQSTDDSARLHWTLGAFWQLAKVGSIEELRDSRIVPFFQYLYGIDPRDPSYYGPYYSCPTMADYSSIPACDVYYNNNRTSDRQIAGYGELSYAFTHWFRLTVGERIAHTQFTLDHYSDGLQNFGPNASRASQRETPNTPKVTASFQVDPNNLFYAAYSKGFRVGGGNAPLPPYCSEALAAAGYANGAPLTYKSDSTQNYEVGSKNTFGERLRIATSLYYIKWNDIQQNLYIAGDCALQFTDNLGEAVAWGGDLQAELALGAVHVDFATGYTSARYTRNSPSDCTPYAVAPAGVPCKTRDGNAISGQAAIGYAPGANSPFTAALGVEYGFRLAQHDAFVRADWQYASRNPWLAGLQDPRNAAQYNPATYTLPANNLTSLRAGVSLGEWQLALFVDNLFDTRTVTNYSLGQPAQAPTVQENDYIHRPRTIGVNASWHMRH